MFKKTEEKTTEYVILENEIMLALVDYEHRDIELREATDKILDAIKQFNESNKN